MARQRNYRTFWVVLLEVPDTNYSADDVYAAGGSSLLFVASESPLRVNGTLEFGDNSDATFLLQYDVAGSKLYCGQEVSKSCQANIDFYARWFWPRPV